MVSSASKESCATWGFIGLGHMGYAMAKRLRLNMPESDTLMVLDVNDKVMDRFVEDIHTMSTSAGRETKSMKVETTKEAKQIAQVSSVIITCLPSPKIVRSVFTEIGSIDELPILKEDRLFIDCSTIDPASSREIAGGIQKSPSAHFIDAPVSGGVVAASEGTLSFMFGAPSESPDLLRRIKHILSLMGKNIWHTGEQGTGVASKLANNYILSINNIATAEAMNMGIRWGLDPKVLTDLINSSTGHCWPTEVNNPVPGVVKDSPASRDYEGGGAISIIHKDLRLAMSGAKEAGVVLTLASEASKVYDAVGVDYSDKDLSVVYKWLQDRPISE